MSTPLDAYLTEAKIAEADFAALIGRERSTVNRLRRGKVKPTVEVAAAIERHTGGKVPMQAWAA